LSDLRRRQICAFLRDMLRAVKTKVVARGQLPRHRSLPCGVPAARLPSLWCKGRLACTGGASSLHPRY